MTYFYYLTKMIQQTEAQIKERLETIQKELKGLRAKQTRIKLCISELEKEKDELEKLHSINKLKQEVDINEWLTEFPWTNKVQDILQNTFKFKEFRYKQLVAINATLSKKDVLLLMPTGGGKSLVYQIPALVNKNVTLVISPLISLIEDQIMALKKLDISAETLNSSSNKQEKHSVHTSMVNGKGQLNLLYVTPEWVAKSKIFMTYLQKCYDKGYLDRIVIDEVHCCSTWGHDFRPEYNHLGFFKGMFPGVPILGLTATATMHVLIDIQKMLSLTESLILTAPYNRPNLYYKVVPQPEEKEDCVTYIENLLKNEFKDQSGIIYCCTIKECEELSNALRKTGLSVKHYHAQLEADQKKIVHQRWLNGKYQAIVATIAFGMGIDKPDVRFVIHHTVPKSMEGLYQESGRAGRDGNRADCILLYNFSDFLRNVSMASSKTEEKNAFSMLRYCLDVENCRRKLFAEYFDDEWLPSHCNKMCDHCNNSKNISLYDVTRACKELHAIISAASSNETKLTLIKLVNSWYQTGSKEVRLLNVPKATNTKRKSKDIIAYLTQKGYLKIDKGFTMYSTVAYFQKDKSVGDGKIVMPYLSDLSGFPLVKTLISGTETGSKRSATANTEKSESTSLESHPKRPRTDQ